MAGFFDASGASMSGANMSGANVSGGGQPGANGLAGGVGSIPGVDPIAAYSKAMQAKLLGYQVNQAKQADELRTGMFDRMQNAIKQHTASGGPAGSAQELYWNVPEFADYLDQWGQDTAKFINDNAKSRIDAIQKTDSGAAQDEWNRTFGKRAGLQADRANNPENWETITAADGTKVRIPKAQNIGTPQQVKMQNGQPVYAPIDLDKVAAIAGEAVARGGSLTPAMLGAIAQYRSKVINDADASTNTDGTVTTLTKNTGDILQKLHQIEMASVRNAAQRPGGTTPQEPGALPGGNTSGAPATPQGVRPTGQRPAVPLSAVGSGNVPGVSSDAKSGLMTVRYPGPGNASTTYGPNRATIQEANDAIANANRIYTSGAQMAANWDPQFFTGMGKVLLAKMDAQGGFAGQTLTPQETALLTKFTTMRNAMGTEYANAVHGLGGSRLTDSVARAAAPTVPHETGSFKDFISGSNSPAAAAAKMQGAQTYAALAHSFNLARQYKPNLASDSNYWSNAAQTIARNVETKTAGLVKNGMDPSTARVTATNWAISQHNQYMQTQMRTGR